MEHETNSTKVAPIVRIDLKYEQIGTVFKINWCVSRVFTNAL